MSRNISVMKGMLGMVDWSMEKEGGRRPEYVEYKSVRANPSEFQPRHDPYFQHSAGAVLTQLWYAWQTPTSLISNLAQMTTEPLRVKNTTWQKSRYLQLKARRGAVRSYFARIGVIKTSQCWWCGQAEQSFEHLYTKFRQWRKERRKLLRNLCKEGTRWQGWTEKRGLTEFLANEKAMDPLLRFLKSTEVGGRERARERELEWGQKDDRVVEELLGAQKKQTSRTQEGKTPKCRGVQPAIQHINE